MDADIIIIGSGIGGATVASALAGTKARVLVVERGVPLRDTPEARDDAAIFRRGFYRSTEEWVGTDGTKFVAGNYYNVGGNSKFYGAVMYRFRKQDFEPRVHQGGTSPGWPLRYVDIEPWYAKAETLFQVHGKASEDPTDPPRSGPFDFPPVPDEPALREVRARLVKAGVHPASLPLAINIDAWLARARTGWDGFPNTGTGKIDAESGPLANALSHPNVALMTGAEVLRLETDPTGKTVIAAVIRVGGRERRLTAGTFVVAAGAVQSTALLLRSANPTHPAGLSNGSDQLGRNFMNHNTTALIAADPRFVNTSEYQKTLAFNDFYDRDPETGVPLGNVQLLGRITGTIFKAQIPWLPLPLCKLLARYAFGWYLTSEDLPNPASRVMLRQGEIIVDWQRSNTTAHDTLVRRTKEVMRRAGFPIVLTRTFGRGVTSHQCGTARMGRDAESSVVTPDCRSHEVQNLWITDASVLPTSAAVNPALTVAAVALRAADAMKQHLHL